MFVIITRDARDVYMYEIPKNISTTKYTQLLYKQNSLTSVSEKSRKADQARSKSWATDNVRIDGRKNSRRAQEGNKWVTWIICIVWMDCEYEWTSHYLVSSMVISSGDMYQSSTSLHVILHLVHGPHTTNVLARFLWCLIKIIMKTLICYRTTTVIIKLLGYVKLLQYCNLFKLDQVPR